MGSPSLTRQEVSRLAGCSRQGRFPARCLPQVLACRWCGAQDYRFGLPNGSMLRTTAQAAVSSVRMSTISACRRRSPFAVRDLLHVHVVAGSIDLRPQAVYWGLCLGEHPALRVMASAARPISPPKASISLTKWPWPFLQWKVQGRLATASQGKKERSACRGAHRPKPPRCLHVRHVTATSIVPA